MYHARRESMSADYELVGEKITLGTILSIVTMFVFITIGRSVGWI